MKMPAPINDEFPEEFSVQRVRVSAEGLAGLPPADIATYFRDHPREAKDLLNESYDKRFTPSSFIAEEGGGFRVGWFFPRFEYKCVRKFSNLADAATDYLLFSLGKGRWNPGYGNLADTKLFTFIRVHLRLISSAATPGSSIPARNSSDAPPPVEM